MNQKHRADILQTIWNRLIEVKSLTFTVKSNSQEESGWRGIGRGEVKVELEGSDVLIHRENGIWINKQGLQSSFTSVYRWKFDPVAHLIHLHHLRLGLNKPVFLLHFAPSSANLLFSAEPHYCVNDRYTAKLSLFKDLICLSWRVLGPKKNEEVYRTYS